MGGMHLCQVQIRQAMTDKESTQAPKWVARIRPTARCSIEDLLRLPVSLDVWERGDDALIAAVSEADLLEMERRKLAHVERICSTKDYVDRGWPGREKT
jgi:hypothetical protein